jgi:hypothetical protein
MREIKRGQSFPLAGFFKRTASLNLGDTRQFVIRFPIWAFYGTRYDISHDEFQTRWWAMVLQLTFERGIHSPALCFRLMWGHFSLLQRAKVFEPKPLIDG